MTLRFLGLDIKNGSVKISGDGNVPISFTAREDIARYMAHVLTTFPADALEWRTFRIEGDRQVRLVSPSIHRLNFNMISLRL